MSVAASTAPRFGRGVLGAVRAWSASTRLAGMTAALLILATLRIPGRPPTLCLLRATTGIPCPFCGGTTAGVDLGRGDPAAALRASPLAVAMAALFVLAPLIRRSPLLRWWGMLPFRARQVTAITTIIAALAASEIWQLARFGII